MKFKPNTLGVRCILKPEGVKKMSAGGIDLSSISLRTQAINTDKGVVFMIGESAWYDKAIKPDIKVGDLVFYAKYGAKTVQNPEDPEDFFILLNDEDILVGYTNE
jgi:co-chaperonin GroES (HSP10)